MAASAPGLTCDVTDVVVVSRNSYYIINMLIIIVQAAAASGYYYYCSNIFIHFILVSAGFSDCLISLWTMRTRISR